MTGKNYKTCKHCTNFSMLTKWVKVLLEKKPVSNLKSMQSVGFEQNLLTVLFCKIIFLYEKNVVETISVIINDSSNVLYFDLYLIHIIGKSMKAERCIGVMFNLTLNEDIDMKI